MTFLTDHEHRALDLTAELTNLVTGRIIGGTSVTQPRIGDVGEFVGHIHAIQHMILAQAAARAYPERYRLLGYKIGDQP